MQTFLPLPDFAESARCLDDKRLFKQAVEARQLVKALEAGPGAGWYNHPACRMWRGFVPCLKTYYNAVYLEVYTRKKWRLGVLRLYQLYDAERVEAVTRHPAWLGSDYFHRSHRSNLLRKDAKHYGVFGWGEPPTLPYVWPKDGADKAVRPVPREAPPARGKRLF